VIEKAGENALAAQSIPLEEELRAVDRYKAFLAKRRELISQRLNEFLETSG
jgi:hypothetical protein